MKSKYWFPSKYRADWNMHSSDMIKLLTGGRQKLPPEGILPQPVAAKKRLDGVVSDVEVTVLVSPAPGMSPDGKRSSVHRVMAICPGCNVMISAGRLFQHKCGAK